jgi:hypothetical protein
LSQKKIFFQKILYVIPSALLSFLPYYCHSFRIFVIPSVLKLLDSQGYLWLPYDLAEVIKLIEETFVLKRLFFQKNTLCHSFRIIDIPSVLLSFLPDYCHSFHITVIPSVLVAFLPNIVIPSKSFRELQILTSSKSFPYPKGEKNGHRRWP